MHLSIVLFYSKTHTKPPTAEKETLKNKTAFADRPPRAYCGSLRHGFFLQIYWHIWHVGRCLWFVCASALKKPLVLHIVLPRICGDIELCLYTCLHDAFII